MTCQTWHSRRSLESARVRRVQHKGFGWSVEFLWNPWPGICLHVSSLNEGWCRGASGFVGISPDLYSHPIPFFSSTAEGKNRGWAELLQARSDHDYWASGHKDWGAAGHPLNGRSAVQSPATCRGVLGLSLGYWTPKSLMHLSVC